MDKIVLAVEKSVNSKTGPVSATYAPIQSCPATCPFLDHGCYAQHGNCGIHLRKLNRNAAKQNKTRAVDIAREEARAIRELKGDLPLRLHIVGDCKTPQAAEIVARACEDYTKKQGKKVWTYTHAWKSIPREKWGDISVLASCEKMEDAHQAMQRGYAASMVRLKPFKQSFMYKGVKMTPCPEMVADIPCNQCGMCLNDTKLKDRKRVICFFPHGSGANHARTAITSHVYIPKN
jgi:hypothetical protein